MIWHDIWVIYSQESHWSWPSLAAGWRCGTQLPGSMANFQGKLDPARSPLFAIGVKQQHLDLIFACGTAPVDGILRHMDHQSDMEFPVNRPESRKSDRWQTTRRDVCTFSAAVAVIFVSVSWRELLKLRSCAALGRDSKKSEWRLTPGSTKRYQWLNKGKLVNQLVTASYTLQYVARMK